jgi:hypothetical protein
LFGKGRREQALRNLCWIRNLPEDDIYLVEEVAYIDAAIEEQRLALGDGFWKVSNEVLPSVLCFYNPANA